MTKVIAGIFLLAILLPSPEAKADPCWYGQYCQPQPRYEGPLIPSWDTPGYYGGNTNGPIQCSPFTYQCQGIAPNPNG